MAAHYIFVFHPRHSEPQMPLLVTRSNTEHKEAHQQNLFCRKCPTPSAENANYTGCKPILRGNFQLHPLLR
jgi:hypothetical protein